jgi:hypothetical protein
LYLVKQRRDPLHLIYTHLIEDVFLQVPFELPSQSGGVLEVGKVLILLGQADKPNAPLSPLKSSETRVVFPV